MKRILALIEAQEHVCFRYRIRAFEPYLKAAGWSVTPWPLARSVAGRLRQFWRCSAFDTVVLQRRLLPAWQLAVLRRQARRLVFDFDDAVLFRDSYDPRGLLCPRRAARFRRTVSTADTVIAGNSFLAECASKQRAHPERIRVLPTCVEPRRYRVRPLRAAVDAGPLELAWIGSSSTLQGIEHKAELWDRIATHLPGTRLRQISDRFARFSAMTVVESPWRLGCEYSELAGSDAGVSWVPDDLWSKGKCGLKILQYQAAGLPVLTNPVGVHAEMVRHGENGFLLSHDDEWVEAVRALSLEPSLLDRLGLEGRASVCRDYSVERWAIDAVAALSGESPCVRPTLRRDSPDQVPAPQSRKGQEAARWSGS